MEHHKKFIKDIGIIGAILALSRCKGIIMLMLISKTLGAESYGAWTQILVILSFIAPIASLGLPSALARFLPGAKTPEAVREHIWSVLFVVLAATLLLIMPLMLFPSMSAILLQTPSSLIAVLALLIALETSNSILVDVFRVFRLIKKYAILNIGLAGGEILFTAASLASGYKLFGAVTALVAARFLILIISAILLVRKIGFSTPRFLRIKEYLRFGLPTLAASFSHWIVQVSDRYFIAVFWGVLYVGYYAPTYTVSLIINLFILPVLLILQPAVSKFFAEKNIQEVKRYLSQSMKYVFFITVPAAFGLAVLSKQILAIFSTDEIALHASPLIPFVALSIVMYGIYAIFSQVFFLFKKTMIDGAIWMFSAALTIVLNFALIPSFGIKGAAIATAITYAATLLATVICAWRLFYFSIDWKFALKTICASFLMSAVISFFPPKGVFQTFLMVVLGVALYIIFMLLMKSFEKNEKEFFKAFLRLQGKEQDVVAMQ